MDDTNTAASARAKPGKMRAFICDPVCVGCGDALAPITIRAEAKSCSDKDVKAAVKALGHGEYTVMTCRFAPIKFIETKRDCFA